MKIRTAVVYSLIHNTELKEALITLQEIKDIAEALFPGFNQEPNVIGLFEIFPFLNTFAIEALKNQFPGMYGTAYSECCLRFGTELSVGQIQLFDRQEARAWLNSRPRYEPSSAVNPRLRAFHFILKSFANTIGITKGESRL